MKQETINLTYDLVDEMKESLEYKRLLELKKVLNTNEEILHLIETFNKLNIKYEETIKYGKFHPDLKKVRLDFSKAKEALYNNETVKEYKKLEKKIQDMLDRVSEDIAKSVSSKIKHPNEIGLINKH